MGRQTKKQRERKQRKATPQKAQPVVSQMPSTTKRGVPRSQVRKTTPEERQRPPVTAERFNPVQGEHPIVEVFRAIGRTAKENPRVQQSRSAGKTAAGVKPSAIQQDEARRRLESLNEMLMARPKPILEQLKEIGIPYQVMRNVPEDRQYDTVVIKVEDIKAADRKIAGRGTLYEQLYKGRKPDR